MIRKESFLSLIAAISIVLILSLSIPISTVSAYTEIYASTETGLSSSGGDLTVLRLKPAYEVKTRDLTFEAKGVATTVINSSGSVTINENYAALAIKNGPKVIAGGSVTCFYSATNVREITINLSSEISVTRGANIVRTSVSGTSLASPGPQTDANYELSLSGSHKVTTDAAPVITESNSDYTEEFENIRISFEAFPRQMDPPADVVTELLNVNYKIEDGVLSGYGYDFFSTVEANDITCTSSMIYRRGES